MNVCNRTEADSQIQKRSVKVTQPCPTLCNPMDCSQPGPSVHGILWNITRNYPECRTAQPFPSSGNLSTPGIEPRPFILQADSLPSGYQGSPRITGVGHLSLLWQIFPTQESNQVLLHCRRILYQLSYQGCPLKTNQWIVVGKGKEEGQNRGMGFIDTN